MPIGCVAFSMVCCASGMDMIHPWLVAPFSVVWCVCVRCGAINKNGFRLPAGIEVKFCRSDHKSHFSVRSVQLCIVILVWEWRQF